MSESRKKILLIEDEPDATEIITGLLKSGEDQFIVECSDRLKTGLERLSKDDIDLVLLDLTLPDSRSLDTLQSVQEQAPDCPIVVLTGTNDESLALQAVKIGAQDYVLKSDLTRQHLMRSIRYALERHHSESILKDNEKRFRALFENSWDGVVLKSVDGLIRYASPAITRILGYAIDQFVGTNSFEYLHPDDRPVVERVMSRLIGQPGSNVTTQFRFAHKDGSWRWVECTTTNRLHDPSVGSVGCNIRDITENKLAEQTLRKREEFFRALIENSWEGVLLLSNTGEIKYSSPSTERILGRPGDEMVRANAFNYMHTDDLERVQHKFQMLMASPDQTLTEEFRYRHLDGTWRWIESYGTNLLDTPSVQAIVVNYRDITERKTNEVALRNARDTLEQRVEERTTELVTLNASLTEQIVERTRAEKELQERNQRLASLYEEVSEQRKQLQSLSHRLVEVQEQERRDIARELHDEVGQVLTGLKMNLELIRRASSESSEAHRASFDQAMTQLNDLVSNVRNLSLNLRPAMLDDLGLLPALLWQFDRFSAQTEIRVKFKHSGIDRRFESRIETAIYRIVQEALTNVARHTTVKETSVLLWATNEKIHVQIEDNGNGFNPESVLGDWKSSGLTGMRERAALLGGRLIIESWPETGTTITAELPVEIRLSQK
ncbi:MAG: PAS domain S-box protein [Acidobacteria bacterium]|nr:PAS domain S-box protein [Acidobacteriota bacterium]